ncbi:MAG: hypothetical protein QXK74_04955 [Candidatus Nitrosocaldaceae archaeon]
MKYQNVILGIMIASILTLQVNGEEELYITTMPSTLISNSDAVLIIEYNNMPFAPEIEEIFSSNKEVIRIREDTIRNVSNKILADLHILSSGNATITVIPKTGSPISKTLQVYESLDIPTKLDMKILPSSLSYIGPKEGYISLQLLNQKGIPIKADKDYIIRLSSSNPNIVSIDDAILKKGEYFTIKHFTINNYGEVIIKAMYNELTAESSITINGYSDLNLKLDVVPNIAPAVSGQTIYAFVQLQDSDGKPIYASNDMYIELESLNNKILKSPLFIKKGESFGVTKLTINSDEACDDCIEIYAVYDRMISNTVNIELREAIRDDIMNISKISTPVFFAPDIHIIADGKEKVIGVVQLMRSEGEFTLDNAKPVIPQHDISINISSKMIDIKDLVIEKPHSSSLISANTGYLAGSTSIEIFGSEVDSYESEISLYGHENVSMVTESLVNNVVVGMNFPYAIYFKDNNGIASYAPNNLNVLTSSTNNLAVESSSIRRGDAIILLDVLALDKGDATIKFETVKSNYKASSTMKILEEDEPTLKIIMDEVMINSTKGLASVELIDSKGYPVNSINDIKIRIYTSNKILNLPNIVTIPQDKHYTIFPIETYNETGKSDIIFFVDGLEPINKSVEVIDDSIDLFLTNNNAILNEYLIITLNMSYKGYPINNAEVRWNNTKGLPIEYDILTYNGTAKAKYLITEEGEHKFVANVKYNGIERSKTLVLNIINNKVENELMNETIDSMEVSKEPTDIRYLLSSYIQKIPIDIKYLLLLPALISIVFSILRKKKV